MDCFGAKCYLDELVEYPDTYWTVKPGEGILHYERIRSVSRPAGIPVLGIIMDSAIFPITRLASCLVNLLCDVIPSYANKLLAAQTPFCIQALCFASRRWTSFPLTLSSSYSEHW